MRMVKVCREAFGVRQLAGALDGRLARKPQQAARTPNASRGSVAALPRCAVSQIFNNFQSANAPKAGPTATRRARFRSNGLQVANLRYCRLKICVTDRGHGIVESPTATSVSEGPKGKGSALAVYRRLNTRDSCAGQDPAGARSGDGKHKILADTCCTEPSMFIQGDKVNVQL
jgi:hypothetical protein